MSSTNDSHVNSRTKHELMDFESQHKSQLEGLQIPHSLWPSLHQQLERTFVMTSTCSTATMPAAVVFDGGSAPGSARGDSAASGVESRGRGVSSPPSSSSNNVSLNHDKMVEASYINMASLTQSREGSAGDTVDEGAIVVMPHLCSWDMTNEPNSGMYNALQSLSLPTLTQIRDGLKKLPIATSSRRLEEQGRTATATAAAAGSVYSPPLKHRDGVQNTSLRRSDGYVEEKDDPPLDVESDENTGEFHTKEQIINQIIPHAWSRVILYRDSSSSSSGSVRGAIPSPPYPPQVDNFTSGDDDMTEADLIGPFPFVYHNHQNNYDENNITICCSLGYMSPHRRRRPHMMLQLSLVLPTIDLVPRYTVPNGLTRSVRYAALLGLRHAPDFAIRDVKVLYLEFVRNMHLVRQKKLELMDETAARASKSCEGGKIETMDRKIGKEGKEEAVMKNKVEGKNHDTKVLKVYTDTNDPMELSHPIAGLTSPSFVLTTSPGDADVIYSYRSLYAPGPLKDIIEERVAKGKRVLINQFPYEGALVQKDHLGREILKQHGLPRPSWALETYDLDVQLGEFVGAAIIMAEEKKRHVQHEQSEQGHLETNFERNDDNKEEEGVLWIIKPAHGTQSKGHVVTRSIAQVLKMVDAGGGSRVAQRYIENPICYDGRKVDCRCIVMMTSADPPGNPTLYMHNRVYFRIAGKKHSISQPADLMDHEAVLTAMHLVNEGKEQHGSDFAAENSTKLPVDYKTIAKLEADYGDAGFHWKDIILPKIYKMIIELFSGMTMAFPAMGESSISRALYGVDVMFEIISDGRTEQGNDDRVEATVEPKLTEVTFCPSNNAICDAYERDDNLYRNYNNDVFSCLFLGQVSDQMTKLL